jgi:hypothetical protein
MKSNTPSTAEAMLEVLISALDITIADLQPVFSDIISSFYNDQRQLAAGFTRRSLLVECFIALCLRNGKVSCNFKQICEIITGNIAVVPNPDAGIINLYADPIIAVSLLMLVLTSS